MITIVTLKLHSQTKEENNVKFSLSDCTGVNKCVNLCDKQSIIIVVLNSWLLFVLPHAIKSCILKRCWIYYVVMIESLFCFHNSDDVDDPVGQLEQQVMGSNGLISQQQAEISQLQGICINLQKVTHSITMFKSMRLDVRVSICH